MSSPWEDYAARPYPERRESGAEVREAIEQISKIDFLLEEEEWKLLVPKRG